MLHLWETVKKMQEFTLLIISSTVPILAAKFLVSCPLDMLWQTLKGQGAVFPSKPSLAPPPANACTQLSVLCCHSSPSLYNNTIPLLFPQNCLVQLSLLLLSQGWGDVALNIHTAYMTRARNRPHRVQAMWLPSTSAVWKCRSDPSSTSHTHKKED